MCCGPKREPLDTGLLKKEDEMVITEEQLAQYELFKSQRKQ